MALRGSTRGDGAPPNEIEILRSRPWENYVRPIKMGPHIYSVSGNDWLAIYLIDTGDGLVMIDTGFFEDIYLVLANMNFLGLKLRDVKHIFLTHGHGDHWGGLRAMKELTGARVYMPREDYDFFFVQHPESGNPMREEGFIMAPFQPDEFYSDNKPIAIGRMRFRTKLCPGHTVGTTAFFFDDTEEETGKTYHVGLHGGIGISSMSAKRLAEFNLPVSLRRRFMDDLLELKKLDIDICLPGYSTQIGLVKMMEEMKDDMDYSVFVDKTIWPELMEQRWNLANELE